MNKQLELLQDINTAIDALSKEAISVRTFTNLKTIAFCLSRIVEEVTAEPEEINLGHEMAGGLTDPSY